MKQWFLIGLLALVVGIPAANANVWDFTFSNPPSSPDISGSGSLTAISLGGGHYFATSGSVTITSTVLGFTNEAFTLSPGGPATFYSPSGAFYADNQFFNSANPSLYLDAGGLLFLDAGNELNIWGNGRGSGNNYSAWVWEPANGGGYTLGDSANGTFTFTSGITPEPGFYGVLALGLGGLCVGVSRRRRA